MSREKCGRPLRAQWVKDTALSLLQLGSLLWHGFSPWPGNFHMPWAWPKKKKRRRRKKEKEKEAWQGQENWDREEMYVARMVKTWMWVGVCRDASAVKV